MEFRNIVEDIIEDTTVCTMCTTGVFNQRAMGKPIILLSVTWDEWMNNQLLEDDVRPTLKMMYMLSLKKRELNPQGMNNVKLDMSLPGNTNSGPVFTG